MAQPANVAPPAAGLTAAQVNVAPVLPLLRVSVTGAVLVVTASPLASSMVTWGCTVKGLPPVAPAGCTVSARCGASAADAGTAAATATIPSIESNIVTTTAAQPPL